MYWILVVCFEQDEMFKVFNALRREHAIEAKTWREVKQVPRCVTDLRPEFIAEPHPAAAFVVGVEAVIDKGQKWLLQRLSENHDWPLVLDATVVDFGSIDEIDISADLGR